MEKSSRKMAKICMESNFKRYGGDYYVSESNAVDIVLEKMDIRNGSGFVIGLEGKKINNFSANFLIQNVK